MHDSSQVSGLHQAEGSIGIFYPHAEHQPDHEAEGFGDKYATYAVLPPASGSDVERGLVALLPHGPKLLRESLAVAVSLKNVVRPVFEGISIQIKHSCAMTGVGFVERLDMRVFHGNVREDIPSIVLAPIICNEVMIGIGNMMINVVLGHQADEAIAATAVFRTLEGIIIAFFSGFSNAFSVLVGTEVGAGHLKTAFARAWRIIYLCSSVTGLACLGLILIRDPLLHAMGLSGASYGIAVGMLIIFSVAAIIRMGNWAQNDTYRAAGDPAFGSTLEIVFMFLLVQPVIHLANDVFHAPFLLVFTLCYCDEPIRYVLMQRHLYSRKWIRPVSEVGKAALNDFLAEQNAKKYTRDRN